jgi:hypothetical protein
MPKVEDILSAPIPGMSLTVEPGSVPWEQPPQYVTIDEVAKYYIDKLTTDHEVIDRTIDALETGVPLVTLADSAITYNAMNGIHTVDAGILIAPVVVELLKTYAELYNIPYTLTKEDTIKAKTIDKQLLTKMVNDKEMKISVEEAVSSIGASAPKGLMSKGVA